MANIPYMKFYIGDWEQDLNACSLQTEAAWLKVIIKMFKDKECGIYRTSLGRLQNLWKCGNNVVMAILDELEAEKICGIKINKDLVEFSNRRMIKAKKISKVRTKAVQTRYKTSTNNVQNPEYESEHDNENENEVKLYPAFDDFWNLYNKKINRRDSEKKWNKLLQSQKEEIIIHVEQYVFANPEKRYRKNPEVYLNKESWNDEIITKSDDKQKYESHKAVIAGYK